MTKISKAFIHERDRQIYEARATGASPTDIAQKYGISTQTVNKAIQRHILQLNQSAVLAYPEILTIELARLDKLQRALWPLTQHRRQTLDDGTTIELQPDPKAVDTVLRIMQQRAKLMGMDITQIDLQTATKPTPAPTPTLKGAPQRTNDQQTPEEEAKQLIELSIKAGILDSTTGQALLEADTIQDAEIVEDDIDTPNTNT